jgi:hypothetical protein
MDGEILEKVKEETDIGLTITQILKPSVQFAKAAATARTVLATVNEKLTKCMGHRYLPVPYLILKKYISNLVTMW